MDIRLIDKWRNVTLVPTKALTAQSKLFEVLDDLLTHAPQQSIDHGQMEFECDREFRDALDIEALRDPDVVIGVAETAGAQARSYYKRVPIIVAEG